ncbi:MAG: hypothetical protein H7256_14880 [Bdellovibrio sp.]|nr:hypothetical protein [Bdellovibrio sp.]
MNLSACASIFFLISSFACAHGEDKFGPNGGYVRMPGAFHTEITPFGKNKLKVFLLDIQWKNPSVVKSDLNVTLNNKAKAKCEIKENYYLCAFPASVDLSKKGELKVLAQREDQKGIEVLYPLPFKLEVVDDGHGKQK